MFPVRTRAPLPCSYNPLLHRESHNLNFPNISLFSLQLSMVTACTSKTSAMAGEIKSRASYWARRLECPVDENANYRNTFWCNRDLIPIPEDRRTWTWQGFAGYWVICGCVTRPDQSLWSPPSCGVPTLTNCNSASTRRHGQPDRRCCLLA